MIVGLLLLLALVVLVVGLSQTIFTVLRLIVLVLLYLAILCAQMAVVFGNFIVHYVQAKQADRKLLNYRHPSALPSNVVRFRSRR